jgi:hypothetical protein
MNEKRSDLLFRLMSQYPYALNKHALSDEELHIAKTLEREGFCIYDNKEESYRISSVGIKEIGCCFVGGICE